ncbi:hypothetical protein Back11_22740 [Paenibacillus baekrokdamisoli]|uniref:Uncharacterized protein n=1 Tax=Paenibacillus baekrokdamisoli TaxID=1712516 RepID=A0A3G9JD87_9BACL|nr:hypothetical protein [Paenibacillus baekrokdamisoli]BBH20929.1 hypothetical protein Back11_22740 [Paenibacillus baekrokdamisoli]
MGEEKPDEELMGKRKSSPRLSTASRDADNYRMPRMRQYIPGVFFLPVLYDNKDSFEKRVAYRVCRSMWMLDVSLSLLVLFVLIKQGVSSI